MFGRSVMVAGLFALCACGTELPAEGETAADAVDTASTEQSLDNHCYATGYQSYIVTTAAHLRTVPSSSGASKGIVPKATGLSLLQACPVNGFFYVYSPALRASGWLWGAYISNSVIIVPT